MAKTDFCIICGKKFTDGIKRSKEHIIPHALGNDRLITFNVCETCNNKIGTNIDAYLTDYIIVKMIRKVSLEKDKDLQILNSYLTDDKGNKFRIRDSGPEVIPSVINMDKENGWFRIGAATNEDGKVFAKKILKREAGLDNEAIDKILNDSEKFRWVETQSIETGSFQQDATLDFSRFKLAAIKIAYEYAVEKLEGYENDPDAAILRAYLLSGRYGKKRFVNEECNDINCRCRCIDEKIRQAISERFSEVSEQYKVRHLVGLVKDLDNQLLCEIRMFDSDVLTFAVLLSKDAHGYLNETDAIETIITEDNEVHDLT